MDPPALGCPVHALDVNSCSTKRAVSASSRVSGFVFCSRTDLQCLGRGKITGLSLCPRRKERVTIEGRGGNLDTERTHRKSKIWEGF